MDESKLPERIFMSRFWASYLEHSCQFSYERQHEDDIEFARLVDPPDTLNLIEKESGE